MHIKFFLLFAFVAATTALRCFPVDQICDEPNQVYSECNANPACQKTCEQPDGGICTKQCVKGCVCKDGYVEDADRNCVKLEECPFIQPICRANEYKTYSQCGAHPSCQRTCANINEEFLICPRICAPGCVCEEGYVQDSEGNCVTVEACPAIQPICSAAEHKEYTECDAYPRNQKTCENPDGPFAIADICMSGCKCEEGYLQDVDGNCLLPEECPAIQPICSADEHKTYTECDAMCKKTCDNPNPMICPAICAPGCICADGYLEDSNGNCVTQDFCPAVQPICSAAEHKEYTECDAYPRNQKTCENPDGPFEIADICMSGCKCEEGYVVDSAGNCILPAECPAIQPICSKAFEEYTDCGTACPLTCENKDNPPLRCPRICVVGCFCSSGYVRNSEGNCVVPEACSAIPPP